MGMLRYHPVSFKDQIETEASLRPWESGYFEFDLFEVQSGLLTIFAGAR